MGSFLYLADSGIVLFVMRICIVSRSWPSNERSGVSLVAAEHAQHLSNAGHEVFIVGAYKEVLSERSPAVACFHMPASGSGALYSPACVDRLSFSDIFRNCCPDVVLIEAWQTALTDAAIDVAAELGLPVVMLSHGVSVHPYTWRPIDVLRSLGWSWYKKCVLPRRLKKLSVLAVLDEKSDSPRFYDRMLAQRLHISVEGYTNTPVNWHRGGSSPEERLPRILVVGYFSPVKNQLAAIRVLAQLQSDLKMCFVGKRSGSYYAKCVALVHKLGLNDRAVFLQDDECDLADQMASSLAVLSTSKTEVLPLTLLEAMASGTPFVATPVGAVPSLAGGLMAADEKSLAVSISTLVLQPQIWQSCARAGIEAYEKSYTKECVGLALERILKKAIDQSLQ